MGGFNNSDAGYVTETTCEKTLLRGCKAAIRILEYLNQNF